MDARTTVLTALTDLLQWDRRQALQFLDVITEHEIDDLEEHIRESDTPIVGVAAVVYRIRLRLAGPDEAARKRASEEAGRHYRLIPQDAYHGIRSATLLESKPQKTYKVAERIGGRRREHDTH